MTVTPWHTPPQSGGSRGSNARFSPLRFPTVRAGRGDARLRRDAGDHSFPKSPLCRGRLLSLHVDAGGAKAKTWVTWTTRETRPALRRPAATSAAGPAALPAATPRSAIPTNRSRRPSQRGPRRKCWDGQTPNGRSRQRGDVTRATHLSGSDSRSFPSSSAGQGRPGADRGAGCSARVHSGRAGCLEGEAGGGGGARAELLSSRSVPVPGQLREPGDSSRGRGRWTRGPARVAGLNFTQGPASACPAWPHKRDFPCEPAGREVRRDPAALSRWSCRGGWRAVSSRCGVLRQRSHQPPSLLCLCAARWVASCLVSRLGSGGPRARALASSSLCTVVPTYLVSIPLKSLPFPPGAVKGPVRTRTRCQDRISLELAQI